MKTTYLLFAFVAILVLSSCSKNEETLPSDFSIEVQADFLNSNEKGYYLFTNSEGEILSEGILENGQNYPIPKKGEDKILHFTYFLNTPPVSNLSFFTGVTVMDINVSSNLILHSALNPVIPIVDNAGIAEVRIDCFGGQYYTSMITGNVGRLSGIQDQNFPASLSLMNPVEETLALRTTSYPPTSASEFQYAIKDIRVGETTSFLCEDFRDASQKIKSITVDVGRTRNIGNGFVRLTTIPDGAVISNPYLTFGTADFRGFRFSDSQTTTLWYLEDWVKSKREYMCLTSVTEQYSDNNELVRTYTQSNYGLYPAPSVVRIEIPEATININHNERTSIITQNGGHFTGNIFYERKEDKIQNNTFYAWLVQFSGEKQEMQWVFPTLSNQFYTYFEVEENIFKDEMIPVSKNMNVLGEYDGDYNQYVKENFTPYNFFVQKAPSTWQQDIYITEQISNQGGETPIHLIDIFNRNR